MSTLINTAPIAKPIQNVLVGIVVSALFGFILAGPPGAALGAKIGAAGGASA